MITSTTASTTASPGTAARLVRRPLLVLHLALGVGWLGVTSTFVVLTVWLLGVRDPDVLRAGYTVHDVVVVWLARPAAVGTAVTGLLLVLVGSRRRARWWLWWVPAKFALLVTTIVVTVNISPVALRTAVADATTVGSPAYTATQDALVFVAVFHVVMITAALVLAVYRPGGRGRRARRTGVTP